MNVAGIEYSAPQVIMLNESGIGTAELAARTCYDSFENSENECIRNFDINFPTKINNIQDSELLSQLAWVHHHHSILEHATISYMIKGTSRGVLQEHARHRIQAISVRSTRYTMSGVINAFVASIRSKDFAFFEKTIRSFDMFVIADDDYITLEILSMWDKLCYQFRKIGEDAFIQLALSKENIAHYEEGLEPYISFDLFNAGKKKRNVGDKFKHIVTDNWKVDMIITFNLRSLKNYFDLRDSGAAYFQIQMLAREMKLVTPTKYLKLIDKHFKDNHSMN